MAETDNTIPAVEKAVLLLEYLGARRDEGATQAELVRELGITPSSCYRILQTLQNADWVRRGANGRFEVSGGILAAAQHLADRTARFEAFQGVLEKLAKQTGLGCKLSIRRGGEQLTVLRAESPRSFAVSGKVGAHFPLIEGSVGAALLCGDEPAAVAEAVARCREEIAEKRNPALIGERLDSLRAAGYALNSGSANRWKVGTMSVPVYDGNGTVAAALTLIGWDEDFGTEHLEPLARTLRAAKQNIEENL